MQNQSLTSLWSVSAGDSVLRVCSSSDGDQIAVGTSTACLILDAKTGRREFHTEETQGAVTAIAFTKGGKILIGGQGVLRLWDSKAGMVLATLELAADASVDGASGGAVVIAAQPNAEHFAAASEHSRKLFLVDHHLVVQRELELQTKCGSLSELSWLSNSTLLATSRGGIQGWLCSHDSNEPSLILGQSIGLVAARASPDHTTLAAGSRDGVVYLWTVVEGDYKEGDESLLAELRSTLKDYTDEVHLLRWDSSGRYIATMDGSETTIWDVPKLFQQPVQSNICCGHDPNSRILCAAFQNDGPVLATGGSDGKVLFYNSAVFQPGQVSQPCAAAQYIPSGNGVACVAWLPGGQLVAGTEGGKVIGWQLQPAAFEDAPGSPISERITIESSETSASRSQPPTTTESAVNGFTKKPLQQKPVQKPLRSSSEAATVNSQAGRYGRGGRILIRDNSSGSLPLERNGSMSSGRNIREATEKMRGDHNAASDSGLQLGESSRSTSLQDGQSIGRRTTSLERQQLSPSLMQHIQRVQQKPAATNRQREPAGWGMGSPSTASPASPQMAYGGPGGMMQPYSAQPVAGAMQPGLMMFPNQAAPPMGPQGMVQAYGFPTAMPHMPMLPHNPAHAHGHQQGMMQNKTLGGMPPGMVYIPMGAQAHQQHWPMVQAPWMGHYYIHPGQSLPDHMNIVSSGRSASAPETSLGFNRPARPIQTSGGSQEDHEYLAKSAISLPHTVGAEWRNDQRGSAPRSEKSNAPQAAPAAPEAATPPAGLKQRSPGNPSEPSCKEVTEEHEAGAWPGAAEAAGNAAAAAQEDSGISAGGFPEAGESSSMVVTVYVGNLPPTVDEVALMVPFSYFGSITNIQVIRDKNSLQSRGFAFVSYSSPVFAAAAIQTMNGRILYGSFRGRALKVGPSNRII